MITGVYIQKKSIIHALNFWTKFLCLLLILPLVSFISPIKLLPVIAFLFLVFLSLSKISYQKFWQMAKLYIVSITIGLLTLSLIFSTGSWEERFLSGLILTIRFVLLISFGVLFSAVTNPIEIPAGFLQAKIPHKFGITLMVGYRMMPLLSQKISTILEAQKARGASFKKPQKLIFQLISLLVPLLYATLEMSTRLSDALISRGYNPEGKITVPAGKINIYDFCFIGTSFLILAITLF